MANEQNLRPGEYKLSLEEAKRGGIKSGEARRKKRQRGEMWRELVNTEVTNEKMLANLRAMGVTEEHPTYEQYIRAVAMKDLFKHAKMQDLERLDNELYGPQVQKVESTVIAPKPLIDLTERKKNGK